MEEKNISLRLKEIKKDDFVSLEALSKEIIAKSRQDIEELIHIIHSDNKDESVKASIVLLGTGDLSISPLLENLKTDNPEDYFWDTDAALSFHLKNRRGLTKIINSMLLDKRELKDPMLRGPVEEKPKPKRICDEAYLMLRKLISLEEDEESLMVNERLFLRMPFKERDKEIERLKSTKQWISLSEQMIMEGE